MEGIMRSAVRVRVFAVGLSVAAALMSAAPVYADTPVDKVGDWVATIGKKDLEKQTILAERRTRREAARAERAARKQARKASKQMDKAGKDLEKGLGGLKD
jgi:hypothetical protein